MQAAQRLTGLGAPVIDFLTPGDTRVESADDAIVFVACSGAVSDNLDGNSTSSSSDSDKSRCAGQPPLQYCDESQVQLEQLRSADPDNVDIVLMSLGGNDARFSTIIKTCLRSNSAADTFWQLEILARLPFVEQRIADIQGAARSVMPRAEIYQMDYPDPFRPNPSDQCSSLNPDDVLFTLTQPILDAVALSPLPWWKKVAIKVGQIVTIKTIGSFIKIDANERAWVSGYFLPELNNRVEAAARRQGVHVLDIEDAFAGHPICSDSPYANGLLPGDDIVIPVVDIGVVGNESFHPNLSGYGAMLATAWSEHGPSSGAVFGVNPNPPAIAFAPFDRVSVSAADPGLLALDVSGPDPENAVFVAGTGGTFTVQDGPENANLAVVSYSLATIAGRGVTDALGNATIPVSIPVSAAPGLHHFELWTGDGTFLGLEPYFVLPPPGCDTGPDVDGDGYSDECDPDPNDGAAADFDADGFANADDNCPEIANASQSDADGDRRGDACDADAGADRFLTAIRPGSPPAATPDSYTAVSGTALKVPAVGGVLANDTDPDHDPLTAHALQPPAHGQLTLAGDGGFTYTPAAGYQGDDSFTYSADDSLGGAVPGVVNIIVEEGVADVALTSSVNPTVSGQSVTFTATVGPRAPATGTPTGTVTFLDGPTVLGTGTLDAGVTTYTTSTLAVGEHAITAAYGGDSAFPASTSAPFTQRVDPGATGVALVGAPNPSTFGQTVTFTATVGSLAPATGTPTGTVTFLDGATALGTGTIAAGQATYSTADLAVGEHSVTATYAGDGPFAASTSPSVTQTVAPVEKTATETSLVGAPNPSTFGQTVTLTATVTPSEATGTVTFRDGPTVLGTGTIAAGQAVYATSDLAVGDHVATATYEGDGAFASSTSTAMTQVVGPAEKTPTQTSVVGTPNPSTSGETVTFTATVTPSTATGTITFLDGTTVLGTGTIAAGQATYATPDLAVGDHAVTATYEGDGTFASSTSTTLTQAVAPVETQTAVLAAPNPSTSGQTVTFTATITPSTATGTVTFTEGATTLVADAPVNGAGEATFTTSSLAEGNHLVTATYNGSASLAASTGSVEHQVATPPSVTIDQSVDQADPTQHAPISFTVVFSEEVTGFTGSDLLFVGGTAGGAPVAIVTGGPTTYNVAVTGTTTSGTVIVSVPAGVATDLAGNLNTASTSTDNTVTWHQDTTKAVCSHMIVAGPPKHVDFVVQDVGSGIASIEVATANNIVTPIPIPAFAPGTTEPVSFTATKDDQAKGAQIAIVVTDLAGNRSSCV